MRVPARRDALRTVRLALAETLEENHWECEATSRVVVACCEALANAVEHGSAAGASVEVEYTVDPAECTLTVRDHGRPGASRPPCAPPEPPPASAPRGRGLVIVHAMADEVEIRPGRGGTEVRLRFARP